jgi:hypothetical protein
MADQVSPPGSALTIENWGEYWGYVIVDRTAPPAYDEDGNIDHFAPVCHVGFADERSARRQLKVYQLAVQGGPDLQQIRSCKRGWRPRMPESDGFER